MSQTLSIQTFLRKYPADLVARYFGSVYGCKSSALAKRSSSRQGKIVAWQGLQPEVRDKVESELGEVIAMSDETGLHAIQTLLSFDTLAPIEKNGDECKKEAETIETRVFRAFIERKSIWPQAVDLAFADRISSRFWKKRNNVPADGLDTSREACEALKERIGAFLAKTDSRGKSCDVEKIERDDRIYFFASFEDFARSSEEWQRGKLTSRPVKRAKKLVFLYDSIEESLSIYCKGFSKLYEDLEAIFAESCLGISKLSCSKTDLSVYDLTPLLSSDFSFTWPPTSRIVSADIAKLRLTHIAKNRRIIFEAPPKGGSQDIQEMLSEFKKRQSLDPYKVSQAEIKVRYKTENGSTRSKRVAVTCPCWCNLASAEIDSMIQQMFIMSGIEPHKRVGDGTPKEERTSATSF